MPEVAKGEDPLCVLVIDDDEALLRMLRLSLTSAGVDVVTAADGFTALERLSDRHFDAILLDLQMPRMDGRTFYHEMKSRGIETSVVIVSAYGAEQARRELRAAAALAKPVDPDVLVETLNRVVAAAR